MDTSKLGLLLAVLADTLLEQVLGLPDLAGRAGDGDDTLRGAGTRLVDRYAGAGIAADFADAGAALADDGAGQVLGNGNLSRLVVAAVVLTEDPLVVVEPVVDNTERERHQTPIALHRTTTVINRVVIVRASSKSTQFFNQTTVPAAGSNEKKKKKKEKKRSHRVQ